MRIGIIGTGAIANLHARAYKNIGWTVRLCTDAVPDVGRSASRICAGILKWTSWTSARFPTSACSS